MQTHQPIINFLTPSGAPGNANRGGNSAKPDVPFNSILAREIERPPAAPAPSGAARQNAEKAPDRSGSANQANQASQNNQANQANQANQSSNADNGPAQASAPAPGKDGSASNANRSDAADGPPADQQDPASDAQNATDPTAALLALVASFNPAPQATSGKPAARTDSASDSVASVKVDAASDPISLTPGKAKGPETAVADDASFGKALAAETSPTEGEAPAISAEEPHAKPLATKPDAKQLAAEPKAVANAPVQAAAAGETLAANPLALRSAAPEAAAPATTSSEGHADISPLAAASAANVVANNPALAKLQQSIAPRVGSQLWDQAVGQHVVFMASNGQQSASLILNPAELGPVQVTLQFSNDQANASFTALQPETRQALEAALPKLREMMSEAGISLGNATVGTGLPNGQQPGQPGQQSGQARGQGNLSGLPGFGQDSDAAPRVLATRPIAAALGQVDTFV
jgi:flagellar hook-length control protein FliK